MSLAVAPAPRLSPEVRRIRRSLRDDFLYYAPRCLKIRTKRGAIEAFTLNRAQRHLHADLEHQRAETGHIRALVLKGRQQGCSTYVAGRYYWRVTHRAGVRVFILTHEAEATTNLFEMARRYHELAPEIVKPGTGGDSARALEFPGLDSGYRVGTAGNRGAGRSSTVQYFHGSEVAYWPHADEHAAGVMQAVPDAPETEVILESTANGVGGYFHEQWQLAEVGASDFQAIFLPWYWQDEYQRATDPDFRPDEEESELARLHELTPEQLQWRRAKIRELTTGGRDGLLTFKQEYPMTPAEAFVMSGGEYALIQTQYVARARAPWERVEPFGDLLVGVDPARFGNDRTAIIRRAGRKAFDVEYREQRDLMDTVGRIVQIIREERPHRVMIDSCGLGAGIVDRLIELGYGDRIVAVNSAEKPFDTERFVNKRAEMWVRLSEWLAGPMPVQIPDDNALHADISSAQYKLDSQGRVQLESKEDAKRRGVRSPDGGDALALTFAPVATSRETSIRAEAEDLPSY